VCPLLDSAQHCPCALRCWSVYRSLFATRTNRRATGTGEESNRLRLSGSAWFDVDRFSNGQRRSCGLAKRPGRHNCSVFWLCTFSEEQATTNERDAMGPGRHAGLTRAKSRRRDGEFDGSFVICVLFWLSLHRLVPATVRKSNLISRFRLLCRSALSLLAAVTRRLVHAAACRHCLANPQHNNNHGPAGPLTYCT
jgi:hypothetical protein